MNGSIRVSAKTVDDAITEALIQLGVTSDKLEYEVIEKGREGFLGIGAKQAVIEAKRKPEPVLEEQKRKPETKKQNLHDERKNTRKKSTVKPAVKEAKKITPQPKENAAKNEEKPEQQEKYENEKDSQAPVKRVTELAEVKEETKKAVEQFLKDTLNAMGMAVQITSDVDSEGALYLDMQGDDMGILIGKRGQTLDALQYLANRVANKNQDGYVRVKLDTENYRARREETLKNLAKNLAYKVKRTKRSISLEPMNPYERRIIHAALQSDPRVFTHSEGEEPYRKVVVSLKK